MREHYNQKAVGYYRNARQELLPYLPSALNDVLEIGCGQGMFGALLKDRFGCSVTGIELVEKAAAEAATRLDRVHVGDALAMDGRLGSQTFDLIVLNDVLEHFLEPGELLRSYSKRLTSGGSFFLTVPNVRHWSVVAPLLLRGQWEYADWGILDRTHFRFYTRRSLEAMVQSFGLGVRACTMHIDPGTRSALANRLTLGLAREFLAPHIVIVAGPT
jgi:2-polyprenyl-3-methyl-5-hydroxy-6-metoxy-1,4-benzoquinol methylase